jgi:hypothetical protein
VNALALNPQPSTLNDPAVALQLRRLSLLSRPAVLGLLNCLADLGGQTAVDCASAIGWASRNWKATDPRIPEPIVRLICRNPFGRFLDDERVTNPAVPVDVPAEDVFRRRLQVKALVVAAMANAAGGTISTEVPKVGNGPPPSREPKPAQRGPEFPRLVSELPDDRHAIEFICNKCHKPTTGPQCSAFDLLGIVCVDCSLEHSEARQGKGAPAGLSPSPSSPGKPANAAGEVRQKQLPGGR